MVQSLHIGLKGPCTNLPFGIFTAIYFDLKVHLGSFFSGFQPPLKPPGIGSWWKLMASAVVCLKKKHTHGSDFHEVNPLTLEKLHYLNKLIISYIFGVDLCQICYNSQTPHQHEIPTASQVPSTRHAKLNIYIYNIKIYIHTLVHISKIIKTISSTRPPQQLNLQINIMSR